MFVPDTQLQEHKVIEEVSDRLRQRFASVDGSEVEAVVHGVAEEFSEARVRDFIPVLVEHIAKDRLAAGGGRAGLRDRSSLR